MKDYIVTVGIIYILIITFILGKMLLEKKDGMKNKKIKQHKRVKQNNTRSLDDVDLDLVADVDSVNEIINSNSDDMLFRRMVNVSVPNKNVSTSGKNLQYKMLKDGFQLSSQAGHLDSMTGISMSDFGA